MHKLIVPLTFKNYLRASAIKHQIKNFFTKISVGYLLMAIGLALYSQNPYIAISNILGVFLVYIANLILAIYGEPAIKYYVARKKYQATEMTVFFTAKKMGYTLADFTSEFPTSLIRKIEHSPDHLIFTLKHGPYIVIATPDEINHLIRELKKIPVYRALI